MDEDAVYEEEIYVQPPQPALIHTQGVECGRTPTLWTSIIGVMQEIIDHGRAEPHPFGDNTKKVQVDVQNSDNNIEPQVFFNWFASLDCFWVI